MRQTGAVADGRVVAEGTLDDIVGGGTDSKCAAGREDPALAALDEAGITAALVGRDLRVPGGDLPAVRAALDGAGVPARLAIVPATFEETFVRLARAGQDRERRPMPKGLTR